MSRNKQKKVTTSSPIDFNDSMTLESWLGVDYARTFNMMIVVGRLEIENAQYALSARQIHEYCDRNNPSRKQPE